ncbi:MAG TPA: hypothetical protein PLW50_00415 [Smithellaceae bacterium]|nr:hypothetical protein [Smithellaceae bacterium]
MEFNEEQKKAAIIAAAAGAGVVQNIILRQYMDAGAGSVIGGMPDMLAGFNKPSSVYCIASGGVALLLSLYVLKDGKYNNALAAYGAASVVAGLASGISVAVATSARSAAASATKVL